ncbi:MAG: DHH family phosphoesterase [Euryarchaeota archaeon]|nr:DHH family phosphoesterase [Euryarchaeota archaeon]
MWELARRMAERLRRTSRVRVYGHIDSDGITGAAIASEALARAGVEHDVTFLKRLDEAALAVVKDENPQLAWFVDFGAGVYDKMDGLDAVITDHHVPSEREIPREHRKDLVSFARAEDRVLMLNPHLLGEGSDAASGAGTTYLVAKAMDLRNTDLAAIAIVGAVADMQEREWRRVTGFNRQILQDGVEARVLDAKTDLRLFGRETRPIHKMLQYASDPWIPRLSGNGEACIAFLLELGLEPKQEGRWIAWNELPWSQKRLVASELVRHMLDRGVGWKEVERLVGETYTLLREESGSPLRDAKEFGTLINACGRYDRADVGYRVCRGDRDEALAESLALLRGHRETIVRSLDFIDEIGIQQLTAIQYFHAQDRIRDTVVGIAASMALQGPGANLALPIVAFALADDGVKVSCRGTRELLAQGLDLAAIMQQASRAVGGEGGGHKVAAGATIPPGTEQEFLAIVDRMVGEQLGRASGFSTADGLTFM